ALARAIRADDADRRARLGRERDLPQRPELFAAVAAAQPVDQQVLKGPRALVMDRKAFRHAVKADGRHGVPPTSDRSPGAGRTAGAPIGPRQYSEGIRTRANRRRAHPCYTRP